MSDADSFPLVRDMSAELEAAAASMHGRIFRGEQTYAILAGKYVLAGAKGYIRLQEESQNVAAKFLIRPMIEAAVYAVAIRADPPLLFRKAFTEYLADVKWAKGIDSRVVANIDAYWKTFTKSYGQRFPEVEQEESKLLFKDAADKVAPGFYERYYRLYSQYSHATVRAMDGSLEPLGVEDHWTVAICTFAALENLKALGAISANFESLKTRLSAHPSQ
jgi:hypothetical protein